MSKEPTVDLVKKIKAAGDRLDMLNSSIEKNNLRDIRQKINWICKDLWELAEEIQSKRSITREQIEEWNHQIINSFDSEGSEDPEGRVKGIIKKILAELGCVVKGKP